MDKSFKRKLLKLSGPIYQLYLKERVKKIISEDPKLKADYEYQQNFGRNINWEHPTELNEKIRWMLYNTDISKWTLLADKYMVREYVKEKGLGNILIPLYGVWEKASDIDFNLLPHSFVIKTNHGSGHVYVVKNKNDVDFRKIKKDLDSFLKMPYGWKHAEIQYYNIPRRIIAEQMLSNDLAFSSSIADYKFYCFKGEPFCCGVFYDRGEHKNASFYDMNWNRHDEWRTPKLDSIPQKDIPCPKTFEQMKNACRILASEFPFVRMDFYESSGNLYFGEYTFTPSACDGGSLSKGILEEMGEMVDLTWFEDGKKC